MDQQPSSTDPWQLMAEVLTRSSQLAEQAQQRNNEMLSQSQQRNNEMMAQHLSQLIMGIKDEVLASKGSKNETAPRRATTDGHKFDGRTGYDAWRIHVLGVLEIDKEVFNNADKQCHYLFSQMTGNAVAHMTHWMASKQTEPRGHAEQAGLDLLRSKLPSQSAHGPVPLQTRNSKLPSLL